MGTYDFQAAVEAARAAVAKSGNDGSSQNYRYPLVYPQAGHSLTVRLLFNPPSGQIVRLVNRHEKVPCYRTYNIECPICKVMQEVKDATGQDPFGRNKASRARGVAFAQYISSTNQIDKGGNNGILQPGELILFMFPWSVYQQINALIQAVAQTPTGMDQAFCHSQSGLFIQVSATADFKYTTTSVPYMTFPTQQSDDDFMKMLDSMDNLNDQVVPSAITQEVDKQVKEYADAIYRQYITPRIPTQTMPAAPQTVNGGNFNQPTPPSAFGTLYSTGSAVPPAYYPQAVTQSPQAPQTPAVPQQSTNAPACYCQHKDNDPQCICCPYEVGCIQRSNPL